MLGLCPFHNEKSPSFTVSLDLQLYHCFGCGKSGDLFKFIMDYDRVDFNKAKEILSEYSGIPLQIDVAKANDFAERNEFYSLNARVQEYFIKNLFSDKGKPARDYLLSRKISDTQIHYFKLGYSLPGFENLKSILQSEKEVHSALKLGLLKAGQNKSSYDFFRDRIMFPIIEPGGKVSGFGGRIFQATEKDEAKYINSPASSIYDKGRMFYNLNNAQNSIRKNRTAILVEGYLDVIGLTTREIDYVIAPLGTALTDKQVRTLKNYADKVVVMLDGDLAGKRAALKAAEICLKENLPAEIVLLTDGKDPFDLSIEKTKLEILDIIEKAIPSSGFIIHETLQNTDSSARPEQKKKALENLFNFIKTLEKETDKQSYLEEGAKQLGLSYAAVLSDYKKENSSNKFEPPKDDNIIKQKAVHKEDNSGVSLYEKRIIAMIVLNPGLLHYIDEIKDREFMNPESALLRDLLYSKFIEGEEVSVETILESGLPETALNSIAQFLVEEQTIEIEERERFLKEIILLHEQKILERDKNSLSISELDKLLVITARLQKLKEELQAFTSRGRG